MRLPYCRTLLTVALATLVYPATAQSLGTLAVTVTSGDAPVASAEVRAGAAGAVTDTAGRARLRLLPGPRTVVVSRIGFHPDTAQVVIVADSTTTLAVVLEALGVELEEITVQSTRVARHLDEEPVRIEVLGGEDVAEKTQMRPSDITRLLSEMVGVRMQAGASPVGSTRLRLQGLAGHYTAIVADGLPLYGGDPGGLAVLQLAPLDLKQAEVIKGTATALFGPSALGGVLNLISRRPDEGQRELVVNRTSAEGTDGLYWGGERLGAHAGLTLFADAHHQALRDVSGDGWADYPEFTRFSFRPRLFVTRPNGDELFATMGGRSENRTGGATQGGGYREGLETRHLDGGLTYRHALAPATTLSFRGSGMVETLDHDFDGIPERNRRHSLFGELALVGTRERLDWVLGASAQREALRARDVAGVDYTFTVPAAFAQVTVKLSETVSLAGAGRCDAHSEYGTQCAPRVALLYRPVEGFSARLSGGTGWYAPTPLTEETDAVGLRRVVFPSLDPERARMAALDLRYEVGHVELSGTLSRSRLTGVVALEPIPGDPQGRERFTNTRGPTDTWAGELFAVYEKAPIVLTAFYGYLHAVEADPAGGRREVALTPRHALGVDLAWEAPEAGTWIALEAFFTGRQALEDNPYRTHSVPFVAAELLAAQRIGPVWIFATLDNIGDFRITKQDPFVLPAPTALGQRTVTPWGPVEGRTVALGLMARP